MRYLVHFSGGIDSVLALLHTLEGDPTGNYDILHIKMKTGCPNFWKAQLLAVDRLLPIIQSMYKGAVFKILKYPSFDLVFEGEKSMGNFMTNIFSILLLKKHHKAYKGIINGNSFQLNHKGYFTKELEILELYGISTPYSMPNLGKDKGILYDSMPEELKQHVWACWQPLVQNNMLVSCGRCRKCKELLSYGIQLMEVEMKDIEAIKW